MSKAVDTLAFIELNKVRNINQNDRSEFNIFSLLSENSLMLILKEKKS